MPSQGPFLSTSAASVANGSGNAWTNPNNANTSDGVYATASTAGTQYTEWLKASNFGFSIPTDGTPTGITVRIRGKVSSGAGHQEFHLQLSKNGSSQIGTDRAYANVWTTSDVTYTYGNGNDLWGSTWSSAEINASTFSVFFAGLDGFAVYPTFSIDFIDVTVTYSLPGGGLFFGFFRKAWDWLTGKREKKQVRSFRPQPVLAAI